MLEWTPSRVSDKLFQSDGGKSTIGLFKPQFKGCERCTVRDAAKLGIVERG
jgi:hypothetical protein